MSSRDTAASASPRALPAAGTERSTVPEDSEVAEAIPAPSLPPATPPDVPPLARAESALAPPVPAGSAPSASRACPGRRVDGPPRSVPAPPLSAPKAAADSASIRAMRACDTTSLGAVAAGAADGASDSADGEGAPSVTPVSTFDSGGSTVCASIGRDVVGTAGRAGGPVDAARASIGLPAATVAPSGGAIATAPAPAPGPVWRSETARRKSAVTDSSAMVNNSMPATPRRPKSIGNTSAGVALRKHLAASRTMSADTASWSRPTCRAATIRSWRCSRRSTAAAVTLRVGVRRYVSAAAATNAAARVTAKAIQRSCAVDAQTMFHTTVAAAPTAIAVHS